MRPKKFTFYRTIHLILLVFTILDQIENVFTRRRDGLCDKHEFSCDNGECIVDLFICDGYDTCGDLSDESEELCQERKCDFNQFRCTTGQCINKNWVCDFNNDCFYSEDEKNCYYFS